MFGSVIFEVAIGIIFLYILVSLICTSIREGIETILKTRAAYLERGVRELLHDREAKNIARSFFEHPMISSLYSSDYTPGKNTKKPKIFDSGKDLPSYIPAKNFALALMDIAARGAKNNEATSDANSVEMSVESIRTNILNIQNLYVQRAMLTALDSAHGSLDRLQENLEKWFDSSMDRVSGWYKRSTQWILFMIGLIAAIGLNINTIAIADYLFRNEDARKLIVARAENAAKDTSLVQMSFDKAQSELAELKLPMGWENGIIAARNNDNSKFKIWNHLAVPVLGWLLTAFAAALGAPFWFDLLNKVMVIRATVKPAEKSGEEGSEDRQNTKQNPVVIQMTTEMEPKQNTEIVHKPVTREGGVLDEESDIDNCKVGAEVLTADEDLPQSEGGIS
ncbi:hypothetical protein SAMN05518672_10457 [Chitinophaga sp. CF118]|uniref:hypothetical protein n=1 Tax=Chitinophaga sp. CF118 TaxID=1884367 RepID=UPI0008F36CF2|nr:hypothetical protein [Chitinophaga sp. CF118]SFD98938.1 hypothetical protein SAMN05518672_10457 [Chitinophaga sp. CF118]